MEGPILLLFDEMGLYGFESLFGCVRLFLFYEIFKHNIIIVMHIGKQQEFCSLDLNLFFQKAYECKINVVGAVKEIFQHKKYIVQLCIVDQPVVRCLKRYSQFEALYQVLQMNFKNIDLGLGQFPSKFQVVNREETRRSYFQQMLNRIISIFLQKMTNETNRRLLSTLYVFLVGNQQKILKSELTLTSSSERKCKQSDNSINSRSSQDHNQKYESAQLEQHEHQQQFMKKKQSRLIEQKAKTSYLIYDANRLGQEAALRLFMACQFLIKFQDEEEWKERYLKLQNSCLLIYKHKNDNNFKTKIELFQAKIEYLRRNKNVFDYFCEKMELDNEPKFPDDTTILTISHEHDFKKFMIKLKEGQIIHLSKIKQLLIKASHTEFVTDFEGVFNPIGKLFITLHNLHFTKGNPKTTSIVYIRIKMSGLVYQTKRMTFTCNSVMSIKQTFILPISNAFANIFVEVIMIENDGIIRHQSQQKCISVHKISFSDFLSYPQGQGLQRVCAKIEKQNNENQMYQGNIQLSIINNSHISSIYADSYANQNDGVIMSGLKTASDTDQLVITVDRVLRVIGNIALFITAFWRNVYLFKYPRMSYTFFIVLILLFNFASAFSYFRLFLYSFIIAMLYHLPFSRKIILQLLDTYVFKHIHKKFLNPLCISKNELKFLQWTTNLTAIKRDFRVTQTGKLEKTQEAKDRKFQEWNFVVHGKNFKYIQQSPSLLQKVFEVKKIVQLVLRMISAVVNTLQKVFNILSWADRRRSIIIFCILFFVANVANTYIFQIIGTIFCIHRLYKGIKIYQKRHYLNNRKLAVYCLRYIINQKFSALIPTPQKIIKTTDQGQIQVIFDSLYFPLRDQNKLRILKESIQHVLGVYIDDQQLIKREVKLRDGKSAFAMIHLVTIIQTCQARLKLQWISGQEGITDQFQELKSLTNEQLVIDLWVQSLLINFFLNVPSQLYTTFRPIRSKESLRLYKQGSNENLAFQRINI